jgi:hypothetical protein
MTGGVRFEAGRFGLAFHGSRPGGVSIGNEGNHVKLKILKAMREAL